MKELLGALVLWLGILGAVAVDAQQKSVRLDGRVQWIAGQTLMLMLDGGGSVNVDLSGVPLDAYTQLRERDRVLVEGVLAADNRQVIATAITPRPAQPAPTRTP
jgi:hypothetical protein